MRKSGLSANVFGGEPDVHFRPAAQPGLGIAPGPAPRWAAGGRRGLIALNSDVELYLGLAAGYVLVPVNSRLAPAEMRAILDDAGVSVVFADAVYPGAAGAGGADDAGDYEDLLAAADEVPFSDR